MPIEETTVDQSRTVLVGTCERCGKQQNLTGAVKKRWVLLAKSALIDVQDPKNVIAFCSEKCHDAVS